MKTVHVIYRFIMKRSADETSPRLRHAGPPLLLPALVYAVLVFLGATSLGKAMGIPHDSVQHTTEALGQLRTRIAWGSFFEFASAVPLAVFMATVVSRLRFLRVRAAGEVIALTGGVVTVGMLFLSALAAWCMLRPGVADSGSVPMLQAVSFACGGPGFAVPLGLFIAGVSVTAGLYRLVPRWLMALGLVVAVACEISSFTLVYWNAAYGIPVGRFIGIVWMIGVAIALPRTVNVAAASESSAA